MITGLTILVYAHTLSAKHKNVIIQLNLFKEYMHSFQRHEGKGVFLNNYRNIIRLDERLVRERFRELDALECVVGRVCGIWQGMGIA